MTGAADDGGEDSPGGIVSGEASLHQAGAVVTHQGGGLVVVTHGVSSETRAHARTRTHTSSVSSSQDILRVGVSGSPITTRLGPVAVDKQPGGRWLVGPR